MTELSITIVLTRHSYTVNFHVLLFPCHSSTSMLLHKRPHPYHIPASQSHAILLHKSHLPHPYHSLSPTHYTLLKDHIPTTHSHTILLYNFHLPHPTTHFHVLITLAVTRSLPLTSPTILLPLHNFHLPHPDHSL